MNSELVEVAKIPNAFFALTAELAAAGELSPEDEEPPEVELLLVSWCRPAREPSTPPSTAPMMTRIPIGMPNFTQGLRVRRFAEPAASGACPTMGSSEYPPGVLSWRS